jgi:phosphoserine phosphatase
MLTPTVELKNPISAIIFDCDGTLSQIEGIDELARENGVGEAVQRLTEAAMGKIGMNPDLYAQRLDLVRPTHSQVMALGDKYMAKRAPDIEEVLATFKQLGKAIYIVSGGLYPAVEVFAKYLQIPSENIFAVDVKFDSAGNYVDFDHTSPLITADGKKEVVQQIKKMHSELIYVGDGLSDLVVKDLVTRFIGYGGAFYRENIERACQWYIKELSMLSLLKWSLTEEEQTLVNF